MRRLLIVLLAVIGLASCANSRNGKAQSAATESHDDGVEILYFHGKKRCITCNAIEKLTKEVVDENFAQQLKDGSVVFRVIDISTKEGEELADRYEVSWSSLYINKWKEGKESRNNMTDFGFSYAKNSPEVFKAGVEKKIEELVK